ncbi:MAG: hypothetical protein IPI67_40685 [Myxococcales bacterium]|nr:hypothetical protein [Myxococcales bacterium]
MKRGLATFGALAGSSPLSRFRQASHEAIAFARQATLLHRDVTASYPRLAEPGSDVVVLLHGLFATAGVLRPMREAIEKGTGAHTASFSYAPGPGVASVAEGLAELVERLPAAVRVHLVGHSMGGLVARWFVQELGGDPRVVQSISLASPFRGTRRGWLMPVQAGRDIVPESVVLRRLAERGDCGVPHTSVVAGADSVVTQGAALHHGDEILIEGCGHNGLLYHPDATGLVVERVLEAKNAARGPDR